jgi:hypothetical protein
MIAPFPSVDWLPEMVLLEIVTVPAASLKMAPPRNAQLPVIVLSTTRRAPLFQMPPPFKPALPFPWIVTALS